ncbi:thimet oligopeptidase, putative,metallo-peptidase, clan MA(E), family M3, putative [Trypanosoma cruzi marinkellei]|uniref:Thimet oligopeptidase, putative,metallo-peptidase, clan MA(E), family M3, putative n=1 Tax=Trypanosoma cruzi marinkellei TaxID=85056 RepID=K2N7M1_TRYCR|nr:thimet oligopeptidase, putative,metallo-peptidase, clan MA(E), family M3, putative [Trypanosoma cruzi marinkellei]
MWGPLQVSEPQAEHVGRVPSFWADERTPPQIGLDNVNPPLAGRLGLAPLTSVTCSGGGGGGSAKEGTAPPTNNGLIVIRGARAALPKSGQESHRTSARCHDSGHDVRVDVGNKAHATPTTACHAVYVTFLSSRTSSQFRRLTAVRKPTCQALTPSCRRYRAMTASASAITLRGIPRRHGENIKSAGRPRYTKESGIMQTFSVTSPCTASASRRSDSIAEKESVATGTRVGNRNAAARREPGSVRGHAQWRGAPLGRSMQGCQPLRGEFPRGARLSGE